MAVAMTWDIRTHGLTRNQLPQDKRFPMFAKQLFGYHL
jgi:hypothetical protein